MIANKLEGIRIASQTAAANAPVLAMYYNRPGTPGETMDKQNAGATFQIDPDNDNDKLSIILKVKYADVNGDIIGAATEEYEIDADDHGTLGEMVAEINKIPGFVAWVLDAPFALDTAVQGDFESVAETAVSEDKLNPTKTLQRDDHDDAGVYLRIGEPTVRDDGQIRLVRIEGEASDNAGGVVSVTQDTADGSTTIFGGLAAASAGVNVPVEYDREDAPTLNGPILVKWAATATTGLEYRVHTMQAAY